MARIFMKGNEAIAEAAIRCGCRFFFGYPITPQSDIPEYMSANLPKVGGVFVQPASEVAVSNMIGGAGATGARVMTSSSSVGIAHMQESFSNLAACGIPVVAVNISRGGPGVGNLAPNQADYNQATRAVATVTIISLCSRHLRCRRHATWCSWRSTWPKNTATPPCYFPTL